MKPLLFLAAGALALTACKPQPLNPQDRALAVIVSDLPEWNDGRPAWGKLDRDEHGRLFQEAKRDSDHQLRAFTEDGRLSSFSLSYLKTEDPMPYVDAMFDVGAPALQGEALKKAKGEVVVAANQGQTTAIDAGGRRFTVSEGLVHRMIKVELQPLTLEQTLALD